MPYYPDGGYDVIRSSVICVLLEIINTATECITADYKYDLINYLSHCWQHYAYETKSYVILNDINDLIDIHDFESIIQLAINRLYRVADDY